MPTQLYVLPAKLHNQWADSLNHFVSYSTDSVDSAAFKLLRSSSSLHYFFSRNWQRIPRLSVKRFLSLYKFSRASTKGRPNASVLHQVVGDFSTTK